jgi:hypothetical protein
MFHPSHSINSGALSATQMPCRPKHDLIPTPPSGLAWERVTTYGGAGVNCQRVGKFCVQSSRAPKSLGFILHRGRENVLQITQGDQRIGGRAGFDGDGDKAGQRDQRKQDGENGEGKPAFFLVVHDDLPTENNIERPFYSG